METMETMQALQAENLQIRNGRLIDPKNGIAGVHMTQLLPFVDPKALALFYAFEKTAYDALG